MVRVALAAMLLSGCAASTMVGASTVTAAALGTSAMQRRSGGCYATCANGTTCNPNTGLCERMPCDGACGRDEHCEVTALESKCAPGPPSDVASRAPGTGKTIPVLEPPPPVEGGPPRVIPAAEQHPPDGK
ncbi:MAG: hypothetical protein ACXWLM_02675 [Myxococcales bacterium]